MNYRPTYQELLEVKAEQEALLDALEAISKFDDYEPAGPAAKTAMAALRSHYATILKDQAS